MIDKLLPTQKRSYNLTGLYQDGLHIYTKQILISFQVQGESIGGESNKLQTDNILS